MAGKINLLGDDGYVSSIIVDDNGSDRTLNLDTELGLKANVADTYTQTVVNSLLDDKANLVDVVNKTDAQTIAGVKTFSSTIVGATNGNIPTAGAASTTIDVGRGAVNIESNSLDNVSGAGITLRPDNNPASGEASSIFAVRSSGQAGRLWVGQAVTSVGDNRLAVGGDEVDGFETAPFQVTTSGNVSTTGTMQVGGSNVLTEATAGLGVNQTWQAFVAGTVADYVYRNENEEYTNSSGKPIQVIVNAAHTGLGGSLTLTVDGLDIDNTTYGEASSGRLSVSAIIPNGSVYKVYSANWSLNSWHELR